jgi:hypothetical protein
VTKLDKKIQDIDKAICQNIDLVDFETISRALISQNLLAYSRDLVEHIAVKAYATAKGEDLEADWNTIPKATEYIKHHNKFQFLRKFHDFLQESESHYTPDAEGAERLVLKYYQFYMMLRNFVKQEYQMDILHNLEKFPINTDHAVQEYHDKIAERLEVRRNIRDIARNPRMYVHKVVPFVSGNQVYYEIVLTPAYDTTSKFDRFVCYSKIMIPSHYSAKLDIYYETIEIDSRKMPVNILTDFMVSIRPCELNNFARIFGDYIKISPNHAEYIGMMQYLSSSGASLLDVILAPDNIYELIKQKMFGKSQVHNFERVLDKCWRLIKFNKPGSNIVRYLLHTLNNKVIKNQWSGNSCWKLSDLYLEWGCIPFDNMPFATSLKQHNPESTELFGSLKADNREHEFLARYILSNMSTNAVLYTPIKEVEEYTENVDFLIKRFNSRLYSGHPGRRIEKFGQSLYIQEAYQNTKAIMEKLQELSASGVPEYQEDVTCWLELFADVDSEEKKDIIQNMFDKTRVSLIYGAAGTGKTYLINHIADYMSEKSILFLANTNPAVENLRRKVVSIDPQKCDFMTIRKFLMSRYIQTEYDILVMDECSMVSNADMAGIIEKVSCEIMLLVGDTYQIESIVFGNWFSMAKYFIPGYAWNELEKPYRTDDQHLLEFWKKVRNLDDDLTEYIVNHRYSCGLDSSVFDKKSEDEIILCLNYDGLYGINNINRFLQENNPSKAYRWGLWTFKVGDPILFNESERFMPVLYNNLKGKIVDIELDEDNDCIWFSIEVDKELSEEAVWSAGLEMLDSCEEGKSIVKFRVTKKKESDDDNDFADDTDIPFQIAYAVSIHKAQGLEYDSVKVIITEEVDELITHNIFYTAITRSKKHLKIYWSPETQEKVISSFELSDAKRDASIFKAHAQMKMYRVK